MSSEINFEFPDIGLALYRAHKAEETWKLYARQLKDTDKLYNLQYAAKLELSEKFLNPTYIKSLEKTFFLYKNNMRKWSWKSGISVVLTRRQKPFLGLNCKCRLYLLDGKNLSKIHDMLGFRIVLCTPITISGDKIEDTLDSVKYCYDVLNETIRFFSEKGYLLIEAEPRSGEEMPSTKFKEFGIVVPNEDYIISGYQDCVKDYVRHPKKRGYQGLHIYVQSPNGLVFEVQIRDFFMNYMAEFGPSSHKAHKDEKYAQTKIDVDLSKVHIPGFAVLPNGVVIDEVGLQKSVDPFNNLSLY